MGQEKEAAAGQKVGGSDTLEKGYTFIYYLYVNFLTFFFLYSFSLGFKKNTLQFFSLALGQNMIYQIQVQNLYFQKQSLQYN